MGSRLSPQDQALYRRTDEVLHYVWDPIGVSRAPEARDEYHSYLPQVFGLLKADADAESIAAHLTEISTRRMGLDPNRKHDLEVAQLLVHWRQVVGEQNV